MVPHLCVKVFFQLTSTKVPVGEGKATLHPDEEVKGASPLLVHVAVLTHIRERHAHDTVHRLVLGETGAAASFTGEKPQPGAERGQTQEDSLKSGSHVSCWSAQDSGRMGAQSGDTRHKQKALRGGKPRPHAPPPLSPHCRGQRPWGGAFLPEGSNRGTCR